MSLTIVRSRSIHCLAAGYPPLRRRLIPLGNATSGNVPKGNDNRHLMGEMHPHVCGSTVHNGQDIGSSKCPSADESIESLVFFSLQTVSDMTSHHRCSSPNTGVAYHCPGLFTAPPVSLYTAHRVLREQLKHPVCFPS